MQRKNNNTKARNTKPHHCTVYKKRARASDGTDVLHCLVRRLQHRKLGVGEGRHGVDFVHLLELVEEIGDDGCVRALLLALLRDLTPELQQSDTAARLGKPPVYAFLIMPFTMP